MNGGFGVSIVGVRIVREGGPLYHKWGEITPIHG